MHVGRHTQEEVSAQSSPDPGFVDIFAPSADSRQTLGGVNSYPSVNRLGDLPAEPTGIGRTSNSVSFEPDPTTQFDQQPHSFQSTFLDNVDDTFWNIGSELYDQILNLDYSGGLGAADAVSAQVVPTATVDKSQSRAESIQRLWFTHVSDADEQVKVLDDSRGLVSARSTPPVTEPASPRAGHADLDDVHRQRLQKRLRIVHYEPTVPPACLLTVWLRLYFVHFNPMFPVIHAATFGQLEPTPASSSQCVHLAACSLALVRRG